MSSRRIPYMEEVPYSIRRAFLGAEEPSTPEELLWRERAARMVLDALGLTGLVGKRKKHSDAVQYARRWFRGIYDSPELPQELRDSAIGTFESAGINYGAVVGPVLDATPLPLEEIDAERD